MKIFYVIIIIFFLMSLCYLYKKIYKFNGNIYIKKFTKPNYNLLNKKVAICMSGQIRDGYDKTLLLHKIFLIDSLNSDVFCCFEETTNEIKHFINKNLNPKKIIYVNDINKDHKSNISHGTLCMYNKIYLANKLKKEFEEKNNFTYDFVIRIRPDLVIKEHLPSYIFNNNLSNKIYMPIISDLFKNFGYPDFMAISNSYNMDIYSNLYNYYSKLQNNQCDISEKLLYLYLNKFKLNVIIFNYPIQLYRFLFDNFDNIFNLIKYLLSLWDRYIIKSKRNIDIQTFYNKN